jgi:hypothetical protein
VLLPIWFSFGAFQHVAGAEELFEVGWGFEGVGSLLFFELSVGGDPEPFAQGHTLALRLTDEAVTFFVGDH